MAWCTGILKTSGVSNFSVTVGSKFGPNCSGPGSGSQSYCIGWSSTHQEINACACTQLTPVTLCAAAFPGFEVVEHFDVAEQASKSQKSFNVPWYRPLEPHFTLTGFKHTPPGRLFTAYMVRFMEFLGVAPAGMFRYCVLLLRIHIVACFSTSVVPSGSRRPTTGSYCRLRAVAGKPVKGKKQTSNNEFGIRATDNHTHTHTCKQKSWFSTKRRDIAVHKCQDQSQTTLQQNCRSKLTKTTWSKPPLKDSCNRATVQVSVVDLNKMMIVIPILRLARSRPNSNRLFTHTQCSNVSRKALNKALKPWTERYRECHVTLQFKNVRTIHKQRVPHLFPHCAWVCESAPMWSCFVWPA